jgi:hypothetical protein
MGSCRADFFRSMPAVHFDLFLYDMRETNNRLFLGKEKQEAQLFSSFQWK